MKVAHTLVPKLQAGVVVAFLALCATIFAFLWTKGGGHLPVITKDGYQVSAPFTDVDNLVFQSDVRMAGVDIGKVERIDVEGRAAKVTVKLDQDVAPLHEGATLTVRNKTMIEETYLEVKDGKGSEIPAGTVLPASAARGSVQLNDLLSSLDGPTRKDLSEAIRSSGLAVSGRQADVDALFAGLGDIGENAGALDALAAQSGDLRSLVRTSTRVLDSLNTQQGQIVDLVRDAHTLARATSKNKSNVESVMRELPPLLDSTRKASASLEELSAPLGTVAANLRRSAPDLDAALVELPATSRDLHAMLPSLDRTLTRAPATLALLPPLQKAASPAISSLEVDLADLNPMLAYLKPYGRDLVSYWSNFTGFVSSSDGNGPIARVKPIFGANSLNMGAALSPMTMYNPYPDPGAHRNPRDFSGSYPHVREDPIPR